MFPVYVMNGTRADTRTKPILRVGSGLYRTGRRKAVILLHTVSVALERVGAVLVQETIQS